MKYGDGKFYEGEFSDGKRHGMGTFIYPQRTKYEGSWRKGRKHGFGSFTDGTGSLRKGEWARGQFIRWVPMTE
jgi:radial spoke head protein 1